MIALLVCSLSAWADLAPDPGCDCSTPSAAPAAFGSVALALGLVLARRAGVAR